MASAGGGESTQQAGHNKQQGDQDDRATAEDEGD
eukprot:SAG22_NODE_210_length_15092_cov_81.740946_6_plen_34_part_00